jgi:hypothetical protein
LAALLAAVLAAVGVPHNRYVTDDAALPRVEDSDLDYDSDLIFTYRGRLFTGVAYEDVPGKWLSEVTYLDGMQDGPAREWFPSGVLRGESHYRENVLHGISREFDEKGRLVTEETHEYGILVSRKKLDASGHVIESFKITPDHQHYARLEHYRQAKQWPSIS